MAPLPKKKHSTERTGKRRGKKALSVKKLKALYAKAKMLEKNKKKKGK